MSGGGVSEGEAIRREKLEAKLQAVVHQNSPTKCNEIGSSSIDFLFRIIYYICR